MKSIFCLLLLLATSCACDSPLARDVAAATSSTPKKNSKADTFAQGSSKAKSSYAAEITRIDEEVKKIDEQLAAYRKISKEKTGCKIEQFLDENNLKRKIYRKCRNGASWYFYTYALDSRTNRIMYVRYEKSGRSRESYGIGSIVEGPEVFDLVLDENGNKIEGAEYAEFFRLQEEAFVGTM